MNFYFIFLYKLQRLRHSSVPLTGVIFGSVFLIDSISLLETKNVLLSTSSGSENAAVLIILTPGSSLLKADSKYAVLQLRFSWKCINPRGKTATSPVVKLFIMDPV